MGYETYVHGVRNKPLRGRHLTPLKRDQFYTQEGLLNEVQVKQIMANLPDSGRATVKGAKANEMLLEGPEWDWLLDHLWSHFLRASTVLGLKIAGIYESPTVIHYQPGDENAWHSDYNEIDRSKISTSVLLNDSSDYLGGELELLPADLWSGQAGDAVIFASHLAHRVLPVIIGDRYVLAAWAGGPELR